MTTDKMEWFSEKFKELLREAEDKGCDVEELCTIAENILEHGWNNKGDRR